jgi:hypothetical protein
MRQSKFLPIAISGVILIGAAVLIVVALANYDGRTPVEVARDERGEDPTALEHCPRYELGHTEEELDPGTEGETVSPGPTSALLCGWNYPRSRGGAPDTGLIERVLRSRADLAKLTEALNSLPPVTPLPEGEYSCEEEGNHYMLIGLRYDGSPEVHLGIGPQPCLGETVSNLQEGTEYEAAPQLLRLLTALFEAARRTEGSY